MAKKRPIPCPPLPSRNNKKKYGDTKDVTEIDNVTLLPHMYVQTLQLNCVRINGKDPCKLKKAGCSLFLHFRYSLNKTYHSLAMKTSTIALLAVLGTAAAGRPQLSVSYSSHRVEKKPSI